MYGFTKTHAIASLSTDGCIQKAIVACFPTNNETAIRGENCLDQGKPKVRESEMTRNGKNLKMLV